MKEIQYRRDLYQLFTEPGQAVEIGVAEGNFSLDMLNWNIEGTETPAITQLFMVDRWKRVPDMKGDSANPQEWHDSNLEQVKKKTEPFGDRAVILQGDSVDMADNVPDKTLTLVYIDGDHSYGGVFADLCAWVHKVKPGGFVALHDYLNTGYGVRDAVDAFFGGDFQIHILNEDKQCDAGAYLRVW